MIDTITCELRESAATVSSVDPKQILEIADALIEVVKKGNQVIFMGNGGSSADAQHLAAEFSGRYLMERPAMAGVCLSNIAPITAIGNDYSYDKVFERQIEAICRKGDAVIGMSTSGNSKNVILAMEKAKEIGAITISFTGPKGKMKDIADYALVIGSVRTPRVQESYFVAGHIICGLVERGVYGKKAVFIDRDDTIAPDVPYCPSPDKFKLFPGVPEAIAKLNAAGYLVVMITNQSGIARGKFSSGDLEAIHSKMLKMVENGGGRIDAIYHCPHHPDEECGCRKPEIGMGYDAVYELGIDPRRSFMVGNSDADIGFGKSMGCKDSIKVEGPDGFVRAVEKILKS